MNTLCIIGGGNMARSLVGGLLARDWQASHIVVTDPVASQRESLETQFGVRTTADNKRAVIDASVVLLAVKPQELRAVAEEIAANLAPDALVVSIAAGIRASDISRWLGGRPVVRCMPNRPALNSCGMTGLYATADVPAASRERAEQLLAAVGATIWVSREADMDTVTAISGSGPAYFFLLVEMLEGAGVKLGLPADVSRRLAIETAYGAGIMLRDSSDAPATLREQVTSTGGTTEAALRHLEGQNVRAIFADAIAAAARRSAELADQFGRS